MPYEPRKRGILIRRRKLKAAKRAEKKGEDSR